MNIIIEWVISVSLTYLVVMLQWNKTFTHIVWYDAMNIEKEWNKWIKVKCDND